MAENHRPLRVPHWLWQQYAGVVGDVGRTSDLKKFVAWQIDNPDLEIGPDIEGPHDFLAKIRTELELWDLFLETVPEDDGAARLRAYIWWRVQNPSAPLPGRRMPPMRRQSRPVACV
jgi:hypothetical protein